MRSQTAESQETPQNSAPLAVLQVSLHALRLGFQQSDLREGTCDAKAVSVYTKLDTTSSGTRNPVSMRLKQEIRFKDALRTDRF
jgi:hypothetical protein